MKDLSPVGFTTSLPVEVILAAGRRPLDLNNAFVNGPDTDADIATAEAHGFPRNMCAWIKGIYGTVKRLGIRQVVGVLSGDCSYTEALLDVLADEGVEVVGFRFPPEPHPGRLRRAVGELARALAVDTTAAEATWRKLRPLRRMLEEADRLCWQEGKVSGPENFQMLINASDFQGDPARYRRQVEEFLGEARARPARRGVLRLGLLGIPPAFLDLHGFLEARGAAVVYNEMPREFAMLETADDLYAQYCRYTYPYPFRYRLQRIRREVERRRLQAVIHYVQSFCYRGLYDRLLRKHLEMPVLTLEGDRPGRVGAREAVRLESFLEMLSAEKGQ